MGLQGKKVSISRSISIAIFASIVIITALSMLIAGYLITDQFNGQAKNASRLASRITELSLNQYINKIVSGIDSINNDAELARDTLLSLAAPNPRRKNFYKFLYRIKEFGKQYQLQQISVYLRPINKDYMIFGAMDITKEHVFSYATDKPGKGLKELERDEYGFIATKADGLRKYSFPFSNEIRFFNQDIKLITKEGQLYLSLMYPLINTHMGTDKDEGQYLVKGMTYGFIHTIIPMPETFLGKLEEETGLRISFFDMDNNYLLGVNPTYKSATSYNSMGTDNITYINYLTPIKLFGKAIAQISTSLERSTLLGEIARMLGFIFASILGSAIVVLYLLSKKLGNMIVAPLKLLSSTAKTIAGGQLSQWKAIKDPTDKPKFNEIDVLNNSFRTMSRQLEQLINEKIKDIESMLANIEQGIFTITSDLTVHPEYSKYLQEIFETNEISNRKFNEFLFDNTTLSCEQKSNAKTVVLTSLGSDKIAFQANSQHLPRTISIQTDKGAKELELDWCPIINKKTIDKIMVTVRDVTELNKLRAESSQKDLELLMIEQLIAIDSAKFLEIYDQTFALLNQCIDLCNHDDIDLNEFKVIFRNLHTAKGLLRTYGMKASSSEIHDIEEAFIDINCSGATNTLTQIHKFRDSIQKAEDTLKQYKYVNDVKLQRGRVQSVLDEHSMAEVKKVIDLFLSDARQAEKLFGKVEHIIKRGKISTINNRIRSLVLQISLAADILGKKPLKFDYQGDDLSLKKDHWVILDGVFTHLIRNSLDHGIETPEARVKAGKEPEGLISTQVSLSSEWLKIVFKDDGRGLNLGLLREKSGLPESASDMDVANTIFQANMSTAEKVTDISGRGVGMDAVKAEIEKFGGKIALEFTGHLINGYIPTVFVIHLPLHKLEIDVNSLIQKAS